MLDSPRQLTFLVTGGAGFIGSHLTELLLKLGYRVLSVDDLSTGSIENIFEFRNHPNFQFARADVMDTMILDRLASQSDIIVHLAAAVGVQLIVDKPVHTIKTNIGGTEAVLEAALRYGSKVLLASTSEVYGKGVRVPFGEQDDVVLGTTDKTRWAYAASKMIDEFLGLAYHREFGLDVIPYRLFNTVGIRQTGKYGMVIPRFVQAAVTGKPIKVFGDGTQSRCFCDVKDVVEAIVGLSLSKKSTGILYNIGGTEEISMLDLANLVRDTARSTSEIQMIPYSEAYSEGFEDMQRRKPDISRINECLGWKPTRSIHDIIGSVIEYERYRINNEH